MNTIYYKNKLSADLKNHEVLLNNLEVIDKYIKIMENKEPFYISFAKVTPNTEFVSFEKGFRITMKASDSLDKNEYMPLSNVITARKQLKKYLVYVTGVDAENKVITVSTNKDNIEEFADINANMSILANEEKEVLEYAQICNNMKGNINSNTIISSISDMRKKQLRRDLMSKLHKNGHFKNEGLIYPAKVVKVYDKKREVIVDLCGLGVYARIPGTRWLINNVTCLSKQIPLNKIVSVRIDDYSSKLKFNNTQGLFYGSRKEFEQDPFIGIEDKFKINDIVTLTCTQIREHNWWGYIEGVPCLEVYCEFPDDVKYKEKIEIIEGCVYQGYIYAVSESRRLLKARVFKKIHQPLIVRNHKS